MHGSLPPNLRAMLFGYCRGDREAADLIAEALVARGEGRGLEDVARVRGVNPGSLRRRFNAFREVCEAAIEQNLLTHQDLVAA